ncbi:holliday junction resolvase / crossover junctionendodeoxyribonuclease [Streptococcus phage Javan616]|nr:holliday junction resolvase / crossover junctionendodeoxyribonuclease [Streptococcus phage Javan616]
MIDGYTEGGLWIDDNYKIIQRLSFEYGGLSGIKGKYRIEIDIEEVE